MNLKSRVERRARNQTKPIPMNASGQETVIGSQGSLGRCQLGMLSSSTRRPFSARKLHAKPTESSGINP